jgi:hypothetical protein
VRRQVTEHRDGWTVDDFTSSDRELAKAVARELDRIDPLPCTEHGDWIDLSQLGKHPDDQDVMCNRCGEIATRAEWAAAADGRKR